MNDIYEKSDLYFIYEIYFMLKLSQVKTIFEYLRQIKKEESKLQQK